MTMFVGFPVTWPRLVIRVSILHTLAVGLISPYMPLPYSKKLKVCTYVKKLLHLKLLKLSL